MLCLIDINDEVELDFTLQVFGSSHSAEPRFIIIGPKFAIACFCTPLENSVKVKIPCLAGIISPGIYKVRFEVIIGEQIFIPIEDEIELSLPIKVEVSMTTKSEVVKPKVDVKMTPKVAVPEVAVPEVAEQKVAEQKVEVESVREPIHSPINFRQKLKAAPVEVVLPPLSEKAQPCRDSLIKTLSDTEKRFSLFKSFTK